MNSRPGPPQHLLRAEVRRQAAGLTPGQIENQLGKAERFAGRSEDDRVIYEEWHRISYLMQPDPHPDSMCRAGAYDPEKDGEPLLCRRSPSALADSLKAAPARWPGAFSPTDRARIILIIREALALIASRETALPDCPSSQE